MLDSVEYLGHQISAEGLCPTKEKVCAVTDAPPPQNVSQLRAFFGLVNYYGKILPQLSSTLAPLYQLLEKQRQWTCGPAQKKAFQEAKTQLTLANVIVHYNPQQEVILACDSSPLGLALCSHTGLRMGLRSQLHLPHNHCPLQKRDTPSWTKKV